MNQETINHSERAHAEFGPSSLKYVATCAGYHGKEGTSGAAEKGTRIHEALEVRDPSALHDEEEVKLYEAILADEEEILNLGCKIIIQVQLLLMVLCFHWHLIIQCIYITMKMPQ